MARTFVIQIPVADLRAEPKPILSQDYSRDENRESQLLFGEKLILIEEQDEWLKVGAIEQPCFDEKKGWHPYIGWIHRSEAKETTSPFVQTHVVCVPTHQIDALTLTYGTYLNDVSHGLRLIPKQPDRTQIVQDARLFLGLPYLWGGRSFQLQPTISSVDCSGLINLLYRAQGLLLPRNAHDQYLKSKPTTNLLPGDPLFLAKEKRICHVILKLDDQTFIESPESGKSVRLLTWGKHIWEEKSSIYFFDRPYSYLPYPSTFLPK